MVVLRINVILFSGNCRFAPFADSNISFVEAMELT